MISSVDCPTGWELPSQIAEMTANLEMPVILTDTGYNNMAESIAVMQKYPHVYADTRWLAAMGAVEIMAEAVGADRLLYSSMAPLLPMQKALNQVLEAQIAGRGQNRHPRRQCHAVVRHLAGKSWSARRNSTAWSPRSSKRRSSTSIPTSVTGRSPSVMRITIPRRCWRACGASASRAASSPPTKACATTWPPATAPSRRLSRGIPSCWVTSSSTPHHLELSCAEMDKYYALPNFAGCEIELTHIPCPTGSPKVRALFKEMAKRGKPVLFMPNSEGDAEAERALGREFPNLNIIHAHSFDGAWARVVKGHPQHPRRALLQPRQPHPGHRDPANPRPRARPLRQRPDAAQRRRRRRSLSGRRHDAGRAATGALRQRPADLQPVRDSEKQESRYVVSHAAAAEWRR